MQHAIVENGTATGIRLADGSEIAARKLVVSTLSPRQLIFDLIGEAAKSAKFTPRVKFVEVQGLCPRCANGES